MSYPKPDTRPRASVYFHKRGKYYDESHVEVGVSLGDRADSHGAVLCALRAAKIEPDRSKLPHRIYMSYDDNEMTGDQAVDLVKSALELADINVNVPRY